MAKNKDKKKKSEKKLKKKLEVVKKSAEATKAEVDSPASVDHCDGAVSDEKLLSIKEFANQTSKFKPVVKLFDHMSDMTRVRIFWMLCHCKLCTTHLSEMLDMSSPAISHHLRLLKDAELIEGERDGREVYYHAADTEEARALHEAIETMIEITCPICN